MDLKKGIPSHDTFGRVFAVVPPQTLMLTLSTWLAAREESEKCDAGNKPAVQIDGKTMRSTGGGEALVHLVGAWASEQGLALGQVAVQEKSNEIEAIPHLLDLLELKDTVATINAAGTQKGIARKIRERGPDSVLAFQRNHPTLDEAVAERFREATDTAARRSASTTPCRFPKACLGVDSGPD